MFSSPFRVLVVVACAFVLFVASTVALADVRSFTPKERRRFDRIVSKLTDNAERDIRAQGRELVRQFKALRKDLRKGRLYREQVKEQLELLCLDLSTFRSPIELVQFSDGEEDVFNADLLRADRIQRDAANRVLGINPADGESVRVRIENRFLTSDNIMSRLNDLRKELAVKVDAEKRLVEEDLAEGKRILEKFIFRRNVETHQVQPLDADEPLAFVRPGIQRIEVTEDGNAKVLLAVAFDEPDSLVRIELKRPDGTVLSTFDAQQRESTNGDSRQLAFEFNLDSLPAAGEPVLFTTSIGFDQSFLSLVDPFDCLAFLFPGLVTPSTPSTPSTAKSE